MPGSLRSPDRNYYRWRRLTPADRESVLSERRTQQRPWHSPHHVASASGLYLLTAACYEHAPIIGHSLERMSEFSSSLLKVCENNGTRTYSWVVLPNHYHVLLSTTDVHSLLRSLGQFHGRTSFAWNGEDNKRGRQIWCRAAETGIRSERHFWATHLYVLNNPVKHRYVPRWQEWPFSSAAEWLGEIGRERAVAMWREFPIDDYGADWDPPEL
jgi:putative transposase